MVLIYIKESSGARQIIATQPENQQRDLMKIATMLASGAVAFAASISASWAGTCATDIDVMVARINAALEARAGAGPGAKEQAVVGGRHIQPTPRSLAATEEKLGELSMEAIEQIKQAITRARAADSAGDDTACKRALLEAERAINP